MSKYRITSGAKVVFSGSLGAVVARAGQVTTPWCLHVEIYDPASAYTDREGNIAGEWRDLGDIYAFLQNHQGRCFDVRHHVI